LGDRLDILEAERLVETVKLRNALIGEAASPLSRSLPTPQELAQRK